MKKDPLVVAFVQQYGLQNPDEFYGVCRLAVLGLMGFGRDPADYGSWNLKKG